MAESPAPLQVTIVGTPSWDSDAAVARWLREQLEREHPGTSWTVREAPAEQAGRAA
jgi:hypothetical protein